MKRREFFNNVAIGYKKPPRLNSGDYARVSQITSLDELTTPLTRRQAAHLLRRMSFMPTPDLITKYSGMLPSDAVESLLGPLDDTPPEAIEADWNNKQEENPLSVGSNDIQQEIEGRLRNGYRQFLNWWLDQMRSDAFPAREKFTLFWSSIWCIEFTYDTEHLIPPPLLYRNNKILRKDRLTDYMQLAEDVTLSGAMLLYQSLQLSTIEGGQIPNENYMRELMELFSMGIGNYSEADVREGSRALTGWRTAAYLNEPAPNGKFESWFSPSAHDCGAKTFMLQTIPARDPLTENNEFLVKEEELKNGIIRIMFEERPEAISLFISEKIYRYFVYSDEGANDSGIIEELAKVLRDNYFFLRPAFKKLFTSQHFFDEANFGHQIKTPTEFIIGFERQLGVKYSSSLSAIIEIEQELYDPPDVSGWEAYRTWISTKTFPLRIKHAEQILSLLSDLELGLLGKKLPNYSDADGIVNSLVEFFLPIQVEQERLDRYKGLLLIGSGVSDSEWESAEDHIKGRGIKEVIKAIIKAPDFQLS